MFRIAPLLLLKNQEIKGTSPDPLPPSRSQKGGGDGYTRLLYGQGALKTMASLSFTSLEVAQCLGIPVVLVPCAASTVLLENNLGSHGGSTVVVVVPFERSTVAGHPT